MRVVLQFVFSFCAINRFYRKHAKYPKLLTLSKVIVIWFVFHLPTAFLLWLYCEFYNYLFLDDTNEDLQQE